MISKSRYHNKLNIVFGESSFYDASQNSLSVSNTQELVSVIKEYPFSSLNILSATLVTDEVINALRDNPNLVFLKLGCESDPYTLTREVFDVLNSSSSLLSIDTLFVIGNYTSQEMNYLPFFNKMVVNKYKVSDLLTNDTFVFYEPLKNEELSYLRQYIKANSTIQFKHDYYDSILKEIDTLSNKQVIFMIPVSNQFSNYSFQFLELLKKGVKIEIFHTQSLKQYLEVDSLLDLMVQDIKESGLSVYGKFLAVIELVTHFKEYLESENNSKESRRLEYILFNYFIVCDGFSELAVALLNKLGIGAFNVDVEFYKEKEVVSLEEQAKLTRKEIEQKEGNVNYHSRVMVRLVDEENQIDGIFVSDPTWDNSLEHHYFNHSLMTFYEMGLESVQFYETEISIFNVSSTKDFLDKVERIPGSIPYFLKIILHIDFQFYDYLKKNYDLGEYSNDFLLVVYNYIITHTKVSIPKETKKKTLYELFNFIYPSLSDDKRMQFMSELEHENEERDKVYFRRG